ncbi:hypothetical protein [Halomonas kalidii]|uniref:Uncharacterized protein n=1 Tax=Halomonas kalidii TaxID=3043293 RepID=A0ABT6VMI3_9GAMM|nr:hypothetical protein [Halomonas kalidii]MDI5933981.1 hypothetical protein [Halomonas kalidii]
MVDSSFSKGRVSTELGQLHRDAANPARWRGHLDKLLAKPSRDKKVSHHPAMPYDEVAVFMAELQGYTSIVLSPTAWAKCGQK